MIKMLKFKPLVVIMILYHKVGWTPELSVCIERENVGAPKRRAFHIDACVSRSLECPFLLSTMNQ
jgi:hypothetical protein